MDSYFWLYIRTTISEVVSASVQVVELWIRFILSQPVLVLFCFALPLVGLGIGLIRRLVRIRA